MALTELGKKPISNARPSGEDVRYEPEFEKLQAEVDKTNRAWTGVEGVDWEEVVRMSAEILDRKSKDLLAAVYLAVGLVKLRNFEGLLLGAEILSDMAVNFWDTMYPPVERMRGRVNAIEWWGERAKMFLICEMDGKIVDATLRKKLLDDLKRLRETFVDKTYENPDNLFGLISSVESLYAEV